MRLIAKLLDKAKNRPRVKEWGMISPFHWGDTPEGEWIVTLHRKKKGGIDTREAGFNTLQEAEAWAEANMSKDGELLIICATEDRATA